MDIRKNNNFGFLRLLFAYLVIISHSSELLDGNRNREILTTIFGTLSFGEFAVDGFFLISGYLIYQSFDQSKNIKNFLIKRVLRIFPAYILATLISILIFAPISSGWRVLQALTLSDFFNLLITTFTLREPVISGVFKLNHYPTLNGSMWTISYEFLCYLTIPLTTFFLRTRFCYLLFAILILCTYCYSQFGEVEHHILHTSIRLFTSFVVGCFFYKFRSYIIWDERVAIFCLFTLSFLMFNKLLAELSLFIAGGYILFYFAFNYKNNVLHAIGIKHDISYGVYLYAWPIQNLLAQYYPNINPIYLSMITIILVSILGYLSWSIVEKPFINMKKNLIAT